MRKHKNKLVAVAVILVVLAGAWFWGDSSEVNVPTLDDIPAVPVQEPLYEPGYSGFEAISSVLDPESSCYGSQVMDAIVYTYEICTVDLGMEIAGQARNDNDDHNAINDSDTRNDSDDYNDNDAHNDSSDHNDNDDHNDITTPEEAVVPELAPEEMQVFAGDHYAMREPVEPEEMTIGDDSFTVTLSVRVHTILYNMHLLDRDKHELVPADGWIFPPTEVTAYEGESVFNVLQREMRRNRIHMVSRWTPIFNSAYVEAINNLYEFDVGPLSGWMYRVNGWFPNFGASRYLLSDGDVIEWLFTVDLGRDLGVYWLGGEQGE